MDIPLFDLSKIKRPFNMMIYASRGLIEKYLDYMIDEISIFDEYVCFDFMPETINCNFINYKHSKKPNYNTEKIIKYKQKNTKTSMLVIIYEFFIHSNSDYLKFNNFLSNAYKSNISVIIHAQCAINRHIEWMNCKYFDYCIFIDIEHTDILSKKLFYQLIKNISQHKEINIDSQIEYIIKENNPYTKFVKYCVICNNINNNIYKLKLINRHNSKHNTTLIKSLGNCDWSFNDN
jgi:hypothetical protein